jgi:predicted transcriptional regulator
MADQQTAIPRSPRYTGARCFLGELEAAILEFLWLPETPARITAKRIWRALFNERENAYTTITTTLHKMAEKGLVVECKVNDVWRFSAALTEDELVETRARPIIQALPADVVARLLAEG